MSSKKSVFAGVVVVVIVGIAAVLLLARPWLNTQWLMVLDTFPFITDTINKTTNQFQQQTKGDRQVTQAPALDLKSRWLVIENTQADSEGREKTTAGFEFVSFASPSALTVKTMNGEVKEFPLADDVQVNIVDKYTLNAASQVAGLSYGEAVGTPALATVVEGDPIRLTYVHPVGDKNNTDLATVTAVLIFPIQQ